MIKSKDTLSLRITIQMRLTMRKINIKKIYEKYILESIDVLEGNIRSSIAESIKSNENIETKLKKSIEFKL